MKIICKDKKEYNQLMKACRYLHDYDFKSDSIRLAGIDFDKHPILSTFAHLYLDGNDFPNKNEFITIEEKKKIQKKKKPMGLSWYKKSVSLSSVESIIAETIRINNEMPSIWTPGWCNIQWAFGNAWRNVLREHNRRIGEIFTRVELDDVLTSKQIAYISKKTGVPLPFKPVWCDND